MTVGVRTGEIRVRVGSRGGWARSRTKVSKAPSQDPRGALNWKGKFRAEGWPADALGGKRGVV